MLNTSSGAMLTQASDLYNKIWSHRDVRVDDWILMSSPLPTLLICAIYVFMVKIWGPSYMKDRKAMNIKTFLIWYNAIQVVASTYVFVQLLRAGWWGEFSLRCQPVDTSDTPQTRLMLHCFQVFFLSKFVEFFDTFCFVATKKFSHVSLLHVYHHASVPLSVWLSFRFLPGGHASFTGLCNSFVHIFMYLYYMISAMGPKYQKYLWWKQLMTTLQMVQFVAIMIHALQLVFYDDCAFPLEFAYYMFAHAFIFFVLFAHFYIKAYLTPKTKLKADGDLKSSKNGHINEAVNNNVDINTTKRSDKAKLN